MTIDSGTRLSQYEILSRIGAGGMGEVYLAEDTRLDRRVALKLLPPALVSDEQAKKRLLREAKAAATLNHSEYLRDLRGRRRKRPQLYRNAVLLESECSEWI
jgi:serine/threonine protein kinase